MDFGGKTSVERERKRKHLLTATRAFGEWASHRFIETITSSNEERSRPGTVRESSPFRTRAITEPRRDPFRRQELFREHRFSVSSKRYYRRDNYYQHKSGYSVVAQNNNPSRTR